MTIYIRPNPEDTTSGTLVFNNKEYPCKLGRGGVVAEDEKQEGDGTTPIGSYKILRGFYRPDRMAEPATGGVNILAIEQGMGWEDDPKSPRYNCFVEKDYPENGDESLIRQDPCYDLVFALDHNGAWPFTSEAPERAQAGKGSAIFMHVWRPGENGKPVATAGCIALSKEDLLEITASMEANHSIEICTPQLELDVAAEA